MSASRVNHYSKLKPVANFRTLIGSRDPLHRLAAVILVVGFGLNFLGCQSFQKRLAQRSSKCGELCERAREARERGNAVQADQLINEALQQQSGDLETRREVAETLWNSGRHAEAAAEYRSLCESRPNDSKLASRLAIMQWECGQKSVAASTAAKALEINPCLPDALLVKARSEAERGKLDESLASYTRLAHISPEDPTMLLEMGELHLKRNHPDRASPLFRAATQAHGLSAEKRSEAEWLLGVSYVQSGRWALAVSTLESAIQHRAATAEDWSYLGWAHLQNGDSVAAESSLQRAIECNPRSPAVRSLTRKMETAGDPLANSKRVTQTTYGNASASTGENR